MPKPGYARAPASPDPRSPAGSKSLGRRETSDKPSAELRRSRSTPRIDRRAPLRARSRDRRNRPSDRGSFATERRRRRLFLGGGRRRPRLDFASGSFLAAPLPADRCLAAAAAGRRTVLPTNAATIGRTSGRSEEQTSELQTRP